MGCTGPEHISCVVIVGIRVGNGHGAKLCGLLGKFRRPGKLGSHIHDADKAFRAVIELFEAFKIRVLQVVRVLGASFFIGEVGTLHLNAPDPGAPGGSFRFQPDRGCEGFFQHVIGQGHAGGREGSDTLAQVIGRHSLETGVITVGEISAGIAVAVDFNETGNHRGTAQVDGIGRDGIGQDLTKDPVFHLKGAGAEPKIGTENSRVFIVHRDYSFRKNMLEFCSHITMNTGKKQSVFRRKWGRIVPKPEDVEFRKEIIENGQPMNDPAGLKMIRISCESAYPSKPTNWNLAASRR